MHPSEPQPAPRRAGARARQHGFTLLELVAAIVVLGIVLSGFVSVYATTMRRSTEPAIALQATVVAEAYINEAASRAVRDPDSGAICGGGEAERSLYDDVCDYDGLAANGCTVTTAACPTLGTCACDRAGQPLAGLRGFAVGIDVSPLTLTGVDGLDVRVEVSHAALGADGVVLETFRTED